MSQATYSGTLSKEHQKLFEQLLARKGLRGTSGGIPRRAASAPAPLSFAQQRLWFFDQLLPGNTAYNVTTGLRLLGPLHFPSFERAFREVVRRHEVLRTRFVAHEGMALQVIDANSPFRIHTIDLSALAPAAREHLVPELARQESRRPFDLAAGRLLRVTLVRMDDRTHGLLCVMHHIISDGWSMGILAREVAQLYGAFLKGQPSPLEELPLQYSDYAVWQREQLEGGIIDEQLSYWKQQLAGDLPVLKLPADRPRLAVPRMRGADRPVQLPPQVTAALDRLCEQEGVTLFVLLMASFQILLARHSGQHDILVGSPIANRRRAETEGLIGFFVSTLVFRGDLSGDPTVRELLSRTREVALGAFSHQDVPFERLVDQFVPERDLGRHPLVQVWCVLQGGPPGALHLPGLQVEPLPLGAHAARFDLSIALSAGRAGVNGSLGYNTDLFVAETIDRMARHWETLVAGMAADPGCRISQLPFLSDAERRQLVTDWNPPVAIGAAGSFPDLFSDISVQAPDRIALVFEDHQMSYGELLRRALSVASVLRSRGVRTEDRIGLWMERSPEIVCGLLGILLAGAAYVPLEVRMPTERLRHILTGGGIGMVLLEKENREQISQLPQGVEWILVGSNPASDAAPAAVRIEPESLAYVIYTSGSTGEPKGVGVEHRQLAHYVEAIEAVLRLGEDATVGMVSTFAADLGHTGVFPTLARGRRLEIVAGERVLDGAGLAARWRQRPIDCLKIPPSHLAALVEEGRNAGVLPQQVLVLGGEASYPLQAAAWRAMRPQCRVVNHYGPTETTVGAVTWEMAERAEALATLPIGRPLGNTQVYVLDGDGELAPVGTIGELYIGGAGVARGYVGQAELTAERFVPDRWSGRAGARLYRSGDMVRYRGDGALEFVGRRDGQVKLRGYRIELGEIEATLRQCGGVREAVVVLREDEPGRRRLAAYVVGEVDTGWLRQRLQMSLPDYMIPTAWTRLEALPLTTNGKVDRSKLPVPERAAEVPRVEPRNRFEATLAEIWATVLQVPVVGVTENFFALGGDSILSIEVVSRARAAGLDFTVRQMYQHPTVEELVRVANSRLSTPSPPVSEEVEGSAPLTPIQLRFLEQEFPSQNHYNQAMLGEMAEEVTAADLERAVRTWLRRHDALRLRLRRKGDSWEQVYASPSACIPLIRIDISAVDSRLAAAAVLVQAHQSLDLDQGPLVRTVWFDRGPAQPAWAALVIHHWAVDGVSWRVLLDDFKHVYAARKLGNVSQPAKTASIKSWAEYLESYARTKAIEDQLSFWVEQGRADAAKIPPDDAVGAGTVALSRHVSVALTTDETRALLQATPRAYRTHVPALLLTAVVLALQEWTGKGTWRIDVEGHGREELAGAPDVSRTVGWFTSIFPVLLTIPAGGGPGDALVAVKEQLRQVPEQGLGYGLLRYLAPSPDLRSQLRDAPSSEICFNYLGQWDSTLAATSLWRPAGLPSGPSRHRAQHRQYVLECTGSVLDGRLEVNWTFSAACHRQETMERLAASFERHLRELIRHCTSPQAGHVTLSDFPLVHIDQSCLDRLTDGGRNVEAIYPLSPLQQGLLFHSLQTPDQGLYQIRFRCRIEGTVNENAFVLTWQQILDRHPILRTSFHWEKLAEPLQVVHRHVLACTQIEDWREFPAAQHHARIEDVIQTDLARGFELEHAPLMRVQLIRVAAEAYEFIWTYHHLLLDGSCVSILLKEVFALYRAAVEDRTADLPPVRPFQDYIAWIEQQKTAGAEEFWRRTLQGFRRPTPVGWDLDGAGRQLREKGRARTTRSFSRETVDAVERFARSRYLTLHTLALGVWAVLLARHSGERDVVFGTVISGRPPEFDRASSMVGVFINTLPLRIRLEDEMPVRDWLAGLQEQHLSLREYSFSSLVDVQGWSEVPRGTPIFESILVFENYSVERDIGEPEGGLRMSGASRWDQDSYPLNVVLPRDYQSIQLRYDRSRITAESVDLLLDRWERVLLGIVRNPDCAVADLPLLSELERRQILHEWNATAVEIPGVCVHQQVAGQAVARPDVIALVSEGEHVSYLELNRRANQLAHELRLRGAGPEVRVGVCLHRSVSLVISLLGILKAGAAFVPLEASWPAERIGFVIKDSQAAIVVSQEGVRDGLPPGQFQVMEVEACWEEMGRQRETESDGAVSLEQLAYVIYTSGSTGRPKGVMITHRGLSNYVGWCVEAYRTGESGGVPLHSPVSTDLAVTSLWGPLVSGGRVVVAREEAGVEGLWAVIAGEEECSVVKVTPAHLEMMREQVGGEGARKIGTLVIGGEALHEEQLGWWREHAPGTRLINEYGPTETVVGSSVWESGRVEGGRIAIGRPVANTEMYVLDERGEPVGTGVPGELYIGGAGVARGYVERPELTAERFVPDGYSGRPGSRMYRTGDWARYRAEGVLEYLGREDDQVKVRGYRIELGEIESVLRECPGVRDAAVVVREATPNDKRLVAYVVGEAEAAELREQLHARLPNYMLPTGWVKLDRLPLSANGKVNRAALPRPEPAAETAEAELTVVEELVAGIWEDVLGCGRAGRYDNFFALGGHSLLATQVVSRIRTAFEIEITIKDLFESPRLRDFACLIERRRRAGARVEVPPIGVVGRVGPLPVSFAQQRLWFMDQLHPGDFAYNVPFALRLRGHLQLDVLTQTFQTIVRRHEAVRTRFISCEGIPFQIIEPGDNFRVARTDLSALRPEDRERALTDISRLEARQPFDLGQAPLLRAIVARVDETDHVLFCTLHHIVSDAWSARILARELAELYSCHVGRRRPNLPDLPVQYADYAVWQRKWLHGAVLERHLDYWRQQLRGPLPTINLTTDGKASGARSAPARQYTTHLAADLTQAVKVLCRQEEVTLFMFFLAVFTLWLSRETRQKDIIVATSVGNRDRTETEGLIAFFVNLLLLRTDLSGNPSFRELLARVRAATLGALAHQELPFERIVEDLRLQHHGGRPAVERVLLMVQRSEAESAGLPGLSVERLPEPAKKTKWDLALFIAEQADELTATWRYRMDLFKPGTVARVSDGFEEILGRVIGNPNGAVEDLTAPAEREKTRMELEYEEFAESALHSFRATRVEGVPVMPGVAGWGGLEI